MGTSTNYLRARRHAADVFREDAMEAARRDINRLYEAGREEVAKLVQAIQNDPMLPANMHRRLVLAARETPAVMLAYFRIRQSLWEFEEFASLRHGSRAILETVIELARDEALPWYVAVPAEDVRRMARLCEKNYAECVRDLETLAITRPARVVRIGRFGALPEFPGQVNDREPLRAMTQWVVRYRRGIPWNKKRAAWWINYDLLCGTGRVLPWFIVNLRTLGKTYFGRNRRMGRSSGSIVDAGPESEAFRAMEERLTKSGPIPPLGLRSALWKMNCSSSDS